MKSGIATSCLILAFSANIANACMSDKACENSSDVSMCCYMNECTPSSAIGCQATRLDFYKHLQTLDHECKMKKFAEELREKSEKVRMCDDQGIHCIDYVTQLMSDPGAFESLEGVGELKPM